MAVTRRGFAATGKKCFVSFGWNDSRPCNLFHHFTSISLVFHSSRVHICLRDKGPFGSGLSGLDLFFNSATRCNQNLSPEYPWRTRTQRGPREMLSLLWISHLQIKTFVPLSLQSPVVHTHWCRSWCVDQHCTFDIILKSKCFAYVWNVLSVPVPRVAKLVFPLFFMALEGCLPRSVSFFPLLVCDCDKSRQKLADELGPVSPADTCCWIWSRRVWRDQIGRLRWWLRWTTQDSCYIQTHWG